MLFDFFDAGSHDTNARIIVRRKLNNIINVAQSYNDYDLNPNNYDIPKVTIDSSKGRQYVIEMENSFEAFLVYYDREDLLPFLQD